RDADGQPVDAEMLERWVVVTRAAFDGLFCLGHDELRRHGQSLLQSGEDLGRIVFGAALGGSRIQKINADLRSQLDEIFTPSGRTKRLNKAVDELTRLDERLREITVSADSWDRTRRDIARLDEKLAALNEREADLTKEASRLERIKRTASFRASLSKHRDAYDTLTDEGVTPDESVGARIDDLLREHITASTAVTNRQSSIAGLRGRLETVGTETSALERTHDITELNQQVASYREAVEQVRQHERASATVQVLPEGERLKGAVTDQSGVRSTVSSLAEIEVTIAGERAELAAKKAELGLSNVSDGDVPTLHVPLEDEIESAREGAAKRMAVRTELAKRLDGQKREISDAEERKRALEAGRTPLPTDAEIDEVRTNRDQMWGVLRHWFVDDIGPPDRIADRGELAREVQDGISRSDAAVDLVRTDTDRAAKVQSEQRQLDDMSRRRQQLEASITEAEDEEREALEAWRDLWDGVADRVGTPKEMSEWRHGWRELCTGLATSASSVAQAESWRSRIDDAAQHLARALSASGHAPPSDAGLLAMLSKAESLIDVEKKRLEDAQKAAGARARLEAIDAKLAELLPLLGPDARTGGDRAIEALHARWTEQKRDDDRRKGLDDQIRTDTEKLARERGEFDRLEAHLQEEAATLGVVVEQLRAVVTRAQGATHLEQKIEECEQQLLDVGDGLNLDVLHAEANAVGDADEITARLAAIDQACGEIRSESTKSVEERLTLRTQFRASAGDDATASMADERERTLSLIADLVDEIVVLTLAVSLLERVVDGARSTGRGPLMERASHYFTLLTDGAYERLDVEPVGEQAFPVAIRADGSRLYPVALSDGTLDQLWLAWRLAGVEHHLDQMGPIPLIVDDVLVNFDDARAGSAFRALASLAERTQVLVLTHHPHLVDVAR
ncbi:MAG: AAA family ATPase, partial [Gemmatimonadaceae bacterium]|nr:AAA family ATPase [Gemmatimonadaceae bacterium]